MVDLESVFEEVSNTPMEDDNPWRQKIVKGTVSKGLIYATYQVMCKQESQIEAMTILLNCITCAFEAGRLYGRGEVLEEVGGIKE